MHCNDQFVSIGGMKFEELISNTFFYHSQTFACGSDGSPIVWRYSQNSDLSNQEMLQESYDHVNYSWLEVDNTKQGYYQCEIPSVSISHTISVYNTNFTTG